MNNKEVNLKKTSAQENSEIVMGVDPGYGRIGIAIVKKQNGKETLIHSECFETSAKLPHSRRLALVYERIKEVIQEFEPHKLGIETLLFGKNQKTALQVAEARGVVIALAASLNLKISEYNPGQIKIAVTGYGKSDKKQVINMIHRIIKIEKIIKYDDEYDAIAAAITCAVSLSTQS